ncbi:hypothetical protein [Cellulomonas cellasea]|uniref:Uncharacterized protein n=1 Tax=Cellulomonas cellasea TaxID=43670 RepID=A0A7W4YBX0_9CELL|nr:hypothetical protein [Cellulomonas cellasea]MBB2923197.1 hypothetical protein [Cellulomonas cellasea]
MGLFWAGTDDDDPITGLSVPASGGHQWPVVPWDGLGAEVSTDTAPSGSGNDADTGGHPEKPGGWEGSWSILTSQTCDIVATGPGQRHPTVQVCPLLRLDDHLDKGQIAEINRGSRVDLITVPDVPGGGNWAADLRISVPVSKGVLLRQDPVHGFTTPEDSQQFAERVAAKYRRPALHDEISGDLVTGLRDLVAEARESEALWPDVIEQFRLLVLDGDRLTPRSVRVLVILFRPGITAEDASPLREWRKREKKRLLRHGIALAPLDFVAVSNLTVTEYRASDPLRVPELGQPAYW